MDAVGYQVARLRAEDVPGGIDAVGPDCVRRLDVLAPDHPVGLIPERVVPREARDVRRRTVGQLSEQARPFLAQLAIHLPPEGTGRVVLPELTSDVAEV